MRPLISRTAHGFIADYPYATFAAFAPVLLRFSKNRNATVFSRALAGATLASALTTNAKWGALKLVPYKAHVRADFAIGALSLGAPWIFGFAPHRRARNTALVMGVAAIAVALLSGILGGAKNK